ncbi:TAP-like protein-domain-containing protein [Apiospora kogelbergensis]|uniref:TAP-like protein-domain-containing protein n=1 Tax=Apiospora kogelbergensis TaxID=1337665 RepID=A0AAW0R5C4_9PEZI
MTMFRLKNIILSSALLLHPAAALSTQNNPECIQWGACAYNTNKTALPVVCGNVSVPLDYTDKGSNESIVLQLVRVSAVAGPLQGVTGGEHDLVAFDPRGTGTTIPFSCYENATAALPNQLQYPDIGANSSDTALGTVWARATLTDSVCAGAPGNKTGELIGTAFVARDFISVVDALKEDGMLRYWGISYGSLLGATIASMFPERIDKLIIDGVLNAHEYYRGFEAENFRDTDKLFSAFIKECADSKCPLARGNVTAVDLEAKVYGLFDALKYNPMPYLGFMIDYSFVKSITFRSIYWPSQWPDLAMLLDSLLTGNLEALLTNQIVLDLLKPGAVDITPALTGIWCSDASMRTAKLADLRPSIDALMAASKLSGDLYAPLVSRCAQWPFAAKERYAGNFTAKTHHPIMLIGNTLDPITPLFSAHNMSAGFEGSVVLEQRGYGHTTLAQASACSANAIREYFRTGKLPEPGTVCEVDDKQIFKPVNSSTAASAPSVARRFVHGRRFL